MVSEPGTDPNDDPSEQKSAFEPHGEVIMLGTIDRAHELERTIAGCERLPFHQQHHIARKDSQVARLMR